MTAVKIPADPTDGSTSPELQSLQDEGFNIGAVAISGTSGIQFDNLNAMISNPALLFDITAFDDFSDFLPAAQVAVPAPSAIALFVGGLAYLAMRRRKFAA